MTHYYVGSKVLLSLCLVFMFFHRGLAEYRFKHLTRSNGIASNSINTIYEDKYGFVWIGTYNGLNRYDGFTIENYSLNSDLVSSVHRVQSMCEDQHGKLWVGTRGGLFLYDRDHDKFLPVPIVDAAGNNVSPRVTSLLFYEDGLLMGTVDGLMLLSIDTKNTVAEARVVKTFPQMGNRLVTQLVPVQGMGILILSPESEKGLYVLNNMEVRLHFRELDAVQALACVSRSVILLSTVNGLYRYNLNELTLEKLPTSNDIPVIESIFIDRDTTVWMAVGSKGLLVMDKDASSIEHIESEPWKNYGLSGNIVKAFFQDSQGNIWIGTKDFGINIYNPRNKKIGYFIPSDSHWDINRGIIESVYHEDGHLWLGTHDGLYHKKNLLGKGDTEKVLFHQFDRSKVFSVSAIQPYRANYLWIGSYFGLFLVDKQQNKGERVDIEEINDFESPLKIFSLHNQSDSILWVGRWSHEDNLIKINLSSREVVWKGLQDPCIQIEPDGDDKLWIASDGKVLELNTKTHEVKRHAVSNGAMVSGVKVLSDGTVWAAAEDGLYTFEGGSFKRCEWLKLNNARPVSLIVHQDELWIGTTAGLVHAQPKDSSFVVHGKDNGLQSDEFFLSSAFYADNFLFFGGMKGLTYFRPEDLNDAPSVAQPFVKNVIVNNNEEPIEYYLKENKKLIPWYLTRSIEFNHKPDVIEIEMAAFEYINPEGVQFQYRLKGFEKNYNLARANNRTVKYTNLDPGNYQFEIIVSGPGAQQRDKTAILDIIIHPPFWQSTFFQVFWIIGVIGITYGMFRWRTARLQKQKSFLERKVKERTADLIARTKELRKKNEEVIKMAKKMHTADQMKLRFFTDLSHELRTPLTLILSPIRQINDSHFDQGKLKLYLNMIEKNAMQIEKLVDHSLDLRLIDSGKVKLKETLGDLVVFIHNIFDSFVPLAEERGIHYQFSASQESLSVFFDAFVVDRVVNNLLSNAFKFTPSGGKIDLKVNQSREDGGEMEEIFISVGDTGTGISQEDEKFIFDRFYKSGGHQLGGTGIGLSLVKDLVHMHGGRISVESEKAKGSTFRVDLKLKTIQYPLDQRQPTLVSHSMKKPVEIKGEGHEQFSLLLVEDNRDIQAYLSSELSDQYGIIVADNGKIALEILENEMPGLIIADIMMPEMDGVSFVKALKADMRFSHIPVLFLTAKSSDAEKIEALKSGAVDYVQKPFDLAVLRQKIGNILQTLSQQRALIREELLNGKKHSLEQVNSKFIQDLSKAIDENMHDPDFDHDALCRIIGMSKTSLYNKLKTVAGISIGEFINTLKLKRAGFLLLTTSYSVSRIMVMVGFNSTSNFYGQFKNFYGVAPKEYSSLKR